MADCIFTKETIKKLAVYTRIKSLLLAAGWTNISSKPATDFDVFYSKGETGDKGLIFQMKENTTTTDYFSSSTSIALYFRLPYSYTPGAAGVSGRFGRPGDAWQYFYAFSGLLGPDADIDFYYHVNKNRIIFVCMPKYGTGVGGGICFVGMSNETFVNEVKSDGVLLASSYGGWGADVFITSRPKEKSTTAYNLGIIKLAMPKEICPDGTRMMTRVGYGDTDESFRGLLDGVYTFQNDSQGMQYDYLSHGDVLVGPDGTSKYLVLSFRSGNNNTWGYRGPAAGGYYTLLAIRVE